jgi:hypothetical protein
LQSATSRRAPLLVRCRVQRLCSFAARACTSAAHACTAQRATQISAPLLAYCSMLSRARTTPQGFSANATTHNASGEMYFHKSYARMYLASLACLLRDARRPTTPARHARVNALQRVTPCSCQRNVMQLGPRTRTCAARGAMQLDHSTRHAWHSARRDAA